MCAAVLAAFRMKSIARPTVLGNCWPPDSYSAVVPIQPPSFAAAQTRCIASGTTVFFVFGSKRAPTSSIFR